ncbi:copper homeostasis membrane protein CopD [Sphingomonas sp.]|uniref:copper homeostasis membrane protein CopD n=1 Tax=Sphingomonas sp. TaxID=28214 RepID=UPI0031E39E5C
MTADWPLIAVRFALYGTLSGLFGLSAFALSSLNDGERRSVLPLRPWLVGGGVAAALLSCIALALLAAAMVGAPAWPIDREAIAMLLSGSATGTAWLVRMIALILASLAAMMVPRRRFAVHGVMLGSGVALATLAWTGHGAMDEGGRGWVHLGADILHLLAAGGWMGALIGLGLLVARSGNRVDSTHVALTHRALHGFASMGTVLVGTILATGIINGAMLIGIGGLGAVPVTLYGQLLLAKLALFGAMLGLAALNRFRLTPALPDATEPRIALHALRRSLAIETACAIAILALVAWLGTLEPPTGGI